MTTVVGLDLSLTSTGVVGVSDSGQAHCEAITSKGKADVSLYQRRERIIGMMHRICAAVQSYAPELIVIEAPAFSRINGHQHDRSGLWWQVVNRLRTDNWPVLEVPPTCRAKYGTGKGNAGKHEVVIAVTRRYPDVEFKTDDEADALLLACIGHRLLGHPIEDSLPQTHLDALKTLTLPEEIHA